MFTDKTGQRWVIPHHAQGGASGVADKKAGPTDLDAEIQQREANLDLLLKQVEEAEKRFEALRDQAREMEEKTQALRLLRKHVRTEADQQYDRQQQLYDDLVRAGLRRGWQIVAIEAMEGVSALVEPSHLFDKLEAVPTIHYDREPVRFAPLRLLMDEGSYLHYHQAQVDALHRDVR